MSVEAEFKTMAENIKKLKAKPSDDEMLILYGLYKQVIVGDINIDKPGITDLAAKAKYDAWEAKKGMSKNDAMSAYITKAKEAIAKYGI